MMTPVRDHRIKALCDWLETLPPGEKFYDQPGARFFADLTHAEIFAASAEMRRRADAAQAEADALKAELARRAVAQGRCT